MFVLNLKSPDMSDLAVVQSLYLKYNNHHTDGEITANPMSHIFCWLKPLYTLVAVVCIVFYRGVCLNWWRSCDSVSGVLSSDIIFITSLLCHNVHSYHTLGFCGFIGKNVICPERKRNKWKQTSPVYILWMILPSIQLRWSHRGDAEKYLCFFLKLSFYFQW